MTKLLKKPDIVIENHGSVFLFKPQTKAAEAWIADNVQAEGWQWLGKALAVDHRYAEDLAAGMLENGLELA